MDIQFAYNVERMLYYMFDEDSYKVKQLMNEVEQQSTVSGDVEGTSNTCQLQPADISRIHQIFSSYSVSDEKTIEMISLIQSSYQILLCPHSATAVYAAIIPFHAQIVEEKAVTTISIITAHPCKFESAIVKAIGEQPTYPADIQHLLSLPQRYTCLEKIDADPFIWRKQWIEILRKDIEQS